MSNKQTIRAWKDAEYRQSLSAEKKMEMPAHPAGLIELSDAQLEMAAGGMRSATLNGGSCQLWTFGCC